MKKKYFSLTNSLQFSHQRHFPPFRIQFSLHYFFSRTVPTAAPVAHVKNCKPRSQRSTPLFLGNFPFSCLTPSVLATHKIGASVRSACPSQVERRRPPNRRDQDAGLIRRPLSRKSLERRPYAPQPSWTPPPSSVAGSEPPVSPSHPWRLPSAPKIMLPASPTTSSSAPARTPPPFWR
jgi:hypothetical protein